MAATPANRMAGLTVAAHWIDFLRDAAARLGCDLSPELAHLGLDEATLAASNSRISLQCEDQLLQRAVHDTGDPLFGLHMGERIRPRFMGELGYAAMSSATLGDAINLMIPFSRITTEFARLDSRSENGRLTLIWETPLEDLPEARHRAEAFFAAAITFGRWITDSDRGPVRVSFRHAAAGSTREYERVFGCPVAFEQPETAVVLDRSLLDLPLRDADADVHRVMRSRIQHALTSYHARDHLLDQVRAEIQRQIPRRPPQLESVADALNLKPWTLRRRLRGENTDFSTLLDAERREAARDRLLYSENSVSEIAAELGYSEQSAFNRAFRRWFGCTPVDYRARHR
jgi:AraC-like DNA-binding protein